MSARISSNLPTRTQQELHEAWLEQSKKITNKEDKELLLKAIQCIAKCLLIREKT